MPRSEGLLLAYLILRTHPERGDEVRALVRELPQDGLSLSTVGQSLIRAKLVTPQEFLDCRAAVEHARQRCQSCNRKFVALPGSTAKTRRCRCGATNEIPAAPDELEPLHLLESEQIARRRASSRARSVGSGRRRKRSGANPAVRKRSGANKAVTRRDSSGANLEPNKPPREIGGFPVLGKIGGGGMGVIYRVRDRAGREVALKVLRRGASKESKTRFRREAEAIARLNHPNVIRVHEVGVDEEGRPFFTMDLVEGRELQEIRHDLPREEFLELVAKVAAGLHHAHEQGIIHRDIKPHNILVSASGEPTVADFGLARDLGRSSLTEMGDLIGTPLFMAPEQLRGIPEEIDRRTDIYALGVVLYEGLTRQLPIEAGNFYELQEQIRIKQPDPPSTVVPDIPTALDRIVLQAIEKLPEDRYQTADELARDLGTFLEGGEVAARPVHPIVQFARRARELLLTPRGLGIAAALFLVGGLAAWMVVEGRRDRALKQQAAALELARTACLEHVTKAQQALQRAHELLKSDRHAALEEVRLALLLADRADAQGKELGDDAPAQLGRDLEALRGQALRVRARALARGGPQERSEALALHRALAEKTPGDLDLHMALGRLELEAGHVKAAFLTFNLVAQQDTDRWQALWLRAEAHRLADQPHFAVLDYERALRGTLEPAQEAEVRASRALASVALGKLPQAKADLRRAQQADPSGATLRLARAAWYRARGEEDESLRELSLAVRTFPDDARVRLAAGRAWAAVGDQRRAMTELDAALKQTHRAEAWLARARLRALLAQDAGATADLEQAVARSRPGDPIRRRVRLAQARHLRSQGRVNEALAALEEPLSGGALVAQFPALLERAELRAERQEGSDLAAAERDLQRVLKQRPRDARALADSARIALLREDASYAEIQLERLLKAQPKHAQGLALDLWARGLLGRPAPQVVVNLGRAQTALLQSAARLQLQVGDPTREAVTGLLLGRRAAYRAARSPRPSERKSGLEAAEVRIRRAVRLAPWLVPARLALAKVLLDRKAYPEALAELDRALEQGAVSSRLQRLRGELLARARRHPQALTAYAEAQRLSEDPRGPAARLRRARLHLLWAESLVAVDRLRPAQEQLDQAITHDPRSLDATRLRANLRQRLGDAQGAEADRKRVELLRDGYTRVFSQARREAWRVGLGRADHLEGLRALAPAFELVSRDRDPERRAELHLIRAYMRLRSMQIAGSLIDLAAMLELAPRAFRQLYDEVVTFHGSGGLSLDVERILKQVVNQRGTQEDVDPDFLDGFVAFVNLEFGGQAVLPGGRLRTGLQALGRLLERQPAHPAALLLRAVLLLHDGQVTEALGAVVAALEDPAPPAFAHYVLARIQATQRDSEGALRSLAKALELGFDVYQRIKTDPALEQLRKDDRFKALVDISQGAGYLSQIHRAEVIALQADGPDKRRTIYRTGLQSATTGLEFLQRHLASGSAEAFRLAGRLYQTRARLAARLGDRVAARRDYAAALEADPGLLLDYDQVRAAASALAPLSLTAFKKARLVGSETLPSGARAVWPAVLKLLTEGLPPDAAVERALAVVRGGQAARLKPLLVLLLPAVGEADEALRWVERLPRDDPRRVALAAWFAARIHVAQGETAKAIAALELARQGGLRGRLGKDPGLAGLATDPRFRRMFQHTLLPERLRWRSR